MRALLSRHNGCVADERIVDAGIRYEIGLELVQIDVQSTIEAQAGRDGADDLSDQTIEVLIVWTRDVQVATADVVYGFVVYKESAVGVLNGAVGRENSVVRLHDGIGDTRSRVDGKLELALLAVVRGKTFKQQSAETRTCTTSEGMEDQETLK